MPKRYLSLLEAGPGLLASRQHAARKRGGASCGFDQSKVSFSRPKYRVHSSRSTLSSRSCRCLPARGFDFIREQNPSQFSTFAPAALQPACNDRSLETTIVSPGVRISARRLRISASVDAGAQYWTWTPAGGRERSGSSPSKNTIKRPPLVRAYPLNSARKARRVLRSERARATDWPMRLFPSNQYGIGSFCQISGLLHHSFRKAGPAEWAGAYRGRDRQ